MAVNTQGGALEFVSTIDTSQFEDGISKMKRDINSVVQQSSKGAKAQQDQLKIQLSQFQSVNTELNKVQHSIETLRGMSEARKNFILSETDVNKIKKYREEITVLEKEIERLSNIGKAGFDNLGNPIKNAGKEIAETVGKTNLLSKSFGFLRTAANLIPGIGLAGIFGLIGTGVVALIKSFTDGGKALNDFKTRYNDLSKALDSGGFQDAIKNVSDLKIQIDLAKKGFIDKKDVVELYNKTMGQTTGQVNTLAEAEQKLTQAGPEYIRMMLLKAAANIALEEAAKKAVEAEKLRQKNLEDFKNTLVDTRISSGGAGGFGTGAFNAAEYDRETERIKKAQQKRKNDQIKIETDAQKQQEGIAKKFLEDAAKISSSLGFDFQGDAAKDLNEKLKDEKKSQTDINGLLSERKSLMDQIIGKQRDAFQSGLLKEKSAVDKINESYENLIKKVEEFNSKARRLGVDKIDVAPIKAAQKIEVTNTIQKQDADDFIKSIEQQKDSFDRFEKYKLSVGVNNAKILVDGQTKTFDNYIDFLKSKLDDLANDQTIGGLIKKDQLSKLLEKATADKAKRDQEDQAKALQDVLSLTNQYEFQKNQIEQKYSKMRAALLKVETNLTKEEFEKRSEDLERLKNDEINVLENNVVRQGALYKKLGEDVIRFTRDQLKQRIDELRTRLDTDTSLTPQMKKDVQAAIDSLAGLLISTDKGIDKIDKFLTKGSSIKGVFDDIASSVNGLNAQLDEALQSLSSMLGNTLQVGQALKDLKIAEAKKNTADQIAAISSLVSVFVKAISFIIDITITKEKEKIKQAQKTIEDFNNQLISGEKTYQELLRDRARQTILNNKLTLTGLSEQQKLLEQQRSTIRQTADDLLRQIQSLTFTASVDPKKKGFFQKSPLEVLSGKSDSVVTVAQSLAGKTFDELEALFNKGQLTGKAKELFEQLQKLKQEGADIDSILEENRRKAAEIFTGTTSDALLDSIVDGFKNGLHSASDFAGTFEDLMRGAIINSLKFKYLEGPLKDFFDQFAKASESDNTLTQTEIDDLKNLFNSIISNADKQFQDLQKIAGLNFASTNTNQQNTLTGSFRTLTEDTGNLLVGQFSGQRIATLQLLDVQRNALDHLNFIEQNTANTVIELKNVAAKMDYYYRDNGVKIK
jgi:hypothetical protein